MVLQICTQQITPYVSNSNTEVIVIVMNAEVDVWQCERDRWNVEGKNIENMCNVNVCDYVVIMHLTISYIELHKHNILL